MPCVIESLKPVAADELCEAAFEDAVLVNPVAQGVPE